LAFKRDTKNLKVWTKEETEEDIAKIIIRLDKIKERK